MCIFMFSTVLNGKQICKQIFVLSLSNGNWIVWLFKHCNRQKRQLIILPLCTSIQPNENILNCRESLNIWCFFLVSIFRYTNQMNHSFVPNHLIYWKNYPIKTNIIPCHGFQFQFHIFFEKGTMKNKHF